jgi:hypothetical protein
MPRNTIKLKVDSSAVEDEGLIVTTGMRPGELIVNTASGLARGATAAAAGEVLVLLEDTLQGETIPDTYTAGDLAKYLIPRRGDVVLMRLAANQTLAIGSPLDAHGALGEIQLATVGTTKQIIGYAIEAKVSGVASLIPVRIA